jgi:hypothetical protein
MTNDHHEASKYGEDDSENAGRFWNGKGGISDRYSSCFPSRDRRVAEFTMIRLRYDARVAKEE